MGAIGEVRPDLFVPQAAMPAHEKTTERVLAIRRWTPTLLSFRTTRHRGFRFTPGHYTRLGLGTCAEDRVWRPYSLASAAWDEHLEFIAVLVPGGAFSDRLQQLRVGDTIEADKASYGFLTAQQLAAGRELWLLASGTGLGPFMAILRDPAVWQDYRRLILAHSVRHSSELAWRDEIAILPKGEPFATAKATLTYLPVVTREPGASNLAERIPHLLADGRLEAAAASQLDVTTSRVLVCGNPEMTRELRQALAARGFATQRRNLPGQMAFEKYWQAGTSAAMRRHLLLQGHSREHHGALKLARAAREDAKPGQAAVVTTLAQHVARSFETGLDPYFRLEDLGVLLHLARAGHHALVQRTLSEHTGLRELAKALDLPAATTLLRFAELLAAHVRFEERELFAAAQEAIAPDLDTARSRPGRGRVGAGSGPECTASATAAGHSCPPAHGNRLHKLHEAELEFTVPA